MAGKAFLGASGALGAASAIWRAGDASFDGVENLAVKAVHFEAFAFIGENIFVWATVNAFGSFFSEDEDAALAEWAVLAVLAVEILIGQAGDNGCGLNRLNLTDAIF